MNFFLYLITCPMHSYNYKHEKSRWYIDENRIKFIFIVRPRLQKGCVAEIGQACAISSFGDNIEQI